MTRLVVDGAEGADTWEHLADGDSPSGRDFTVSIGRWYRERRNLLTYVERIDLALGVRLGMDSDPAGLAGDIERFTLIVIEIPESADGRFFSIAARVREHLRYRGELRVTGDIAPDQLSFMQRCGINAFEIPDDVDIGRFIRRYERFYQSSGPMTTTDTLIGSVRRRSAAWPSRPGDEDPASEIEATAG